MKSILNIIFLFTSILSCIKILSTKSVSSALIPFIMVLGIGLIMDLIEELKRYKNDLETNKSLTKVYKNKIFRKIKWSEIKIGNLMKIKKDEIIPADLFVLCSSNKDGAFYLKTANLDGESNLKQREVLVDTQKIFYKKKDKDKDKNLENIFEAYNEIEEKSYIEVDQPNKDINRINGKIIFDGKEKFFDIKNTAIRGAILKNTKFIYGIVIYTGKETKIMKNFIKVKSKYAYLDKLVDHISLVIIIVRIVYVLIFMMIGILIKNKYKPDYENGKVGYDYIYYYNENTKTYLENIKYFTSHFILSQTLLPTSVAVLLALTKVVQSLFLEFLERGLRMKPNQKIKCFSSELLGELGSVKYIFSDKTGTLTKNQTQFKACSIFTSLFDESNEKTQSDIFNINSTSKARSLYHSFSVSNFSLKFNVDNLLRRLKLRNIPLDLKNLENCPFKNQGEALEEFVLNMAINHDIIVDNFDEDKKEKNNNENNNNIEEIKYQGTNPDEITLVGAARELGYCFLGKVGNLISVKRIIFSSDGKVEKTEIKTYKILLKIPFSSERQRSTIIVEDLNNKKIKLYIKGSDTKIFEKINYYSQENILEITKEHVDNFARRGLRTLCYSFKVISEMEYKLWSKNYEKIKGSSLENKEELLNKSIEEIEKNTYLLGATALEDQMQDNVKNDIQQFIEAGINFWMLTGDKMDTAESIGHSIKLFDSDTEVFKIKGSNEAQVIYKMEEIKKNIKNAQRDLSKITLLNKGKVGIGKRMDFNTKFNLFKNRIKNSIEVIYEEEENGINMENYYNLNQSENISEKRLKNKKYFIENGSQNYIISDNKSLNNQIYNCINEINVDVKKANLIEQNQKKKNNEDMSILKFMIDNQYFENSNIDFEVLSIIQNDAAQKNLAFSFNSQKSSEEDLEVIKENENVIKNLNNIININNIKSKNKRPLFLKEKSCEEEKTNHTTNEMMNSDQFLTLKKVKRKKVNLPIEEQEFLKYFEKCIENLREYFYIEQKSFSLFKIPYLYGLIKEEKNPLTEDIKKKDWKQKLNLKNYLLHTKIKYSLIISGECIQYCLSPGEASNLFWFLIEHSRSIICCRCSPKQKRDIVEFVKSRTKETTLAIGDGENDVNMIKAANVGVGIFGKEGSQAAFNSDYAFYEFKYLRILLFINGRFSLLRNTYFLNMFFFKNFLYTFEAIIFTFFSLYSGVFYFDEFYDSMFNTFVSIIPLIVFSIIDEDFNPDFLKKDFNRNIIFLLPDMYKQTRDSKPFNLVKYIITTFISLILSLILFLILNYSFKDSIKNISGDVSSYYELIFFNYVAILIIHFFMVIIDSSLFNFIVIIFFVIQIFLDIIFIVVMNRIPNDNKLSGVTSFLFSINHLLGLIAGCIIICLPFYVLRRMEYFFGLNLSNLIKNNNIEDFLKAKFYTKKIKQMIRAISAVIKFKRIHNDMISETKIDGSKKEKYDNLIDINMVKVVEHFEKDRKKNKRKIK